MNQIDLSDRKAVVTGGARGIGLAIATRLMQSGADVSLWDVDTEAAAQAKTSLSKYGKVETQTVDLTDEDAVAAATEASAGRSHRGFGRGPTGHGPTAARHDR